MRRLSLYSIVWIIFFQEASESFLNCAYFTYKSFVLIRVTECVSMTMFGWVQFWVQLAWLALDEYACLPVWLSVCQSVSGNCCTEIWLFKVHREYLSKQQCDRHTA